MEPHQLLESVLFVAPEPVTVAQLSSALDLPADAVEVALERLTQACAERGVRVQRHGDQVQLVTAPDAAAVVSRFLGVAGRGKLSGAALEVLAIVAYRQPLTRAQIEAIRGVDCSAVVRALLARELIAEVGRLETAGRPMLYGVTPLFMRQFGIASLTDLPPIESLPSVTQ
jgi:segregation and condensation protein B